MRNDIIRPLEHTHCLGHQLSDIIQKFPGNKINLKLIPINLFVTVILSPLRCPLSFVRCPFVCLTVCCHDPRPVCVTVQIAGNFETNSGLILGWARDQQIGLQRLFKIVPQNKKMPDFNIISRLTETYPKRIVLLIFQTRQLIYTAFKLVTYYS